jgi:hypothetical protein
MSIILMSDEHADCVSSICVRNMFKTNCHHIKTFPIIAILVFSKYGSNIFHSTDFKDPAWNNINVITSHVSTTSW